MARTKGAISKIEFVVSCPAIRDVARFKQRAAASRWLDSHYEHLRNIEIWKPTGEKIGGRYELWTCTERFTLEPDSLWNPISNLASS